MTKQQRRMAGAGGMWQDKRTGLWVAQVRVKDPLTGKSRQVRRRAKTRDQARDLLRNLREQGPTALPMPGDDHTLAYFLRAYLEHSLPRTSLAPSTQRIHHDLLTWYAIPAAGVVTLNGFTPAVADQWVGRIQQHKKRNGDPISPNTVRNTFNAAVRALDVAVRDELLPRNPLRLIDRPKVARPEVPVTRPDQVDATLQQAQGRRVEPLVLFVAFTGVRIGEALALRWSDVDLAAGTAVIRKGSTSRATTKSERVRTVTLVPPVVAALTARRTQQRTERLAFGAGWPDTAGHVFTTAVGTVVTRDNASRDLRSILRAAGVTEARPWHSLRHGLVHRLVKQGVPLPMISAMIGHQSVAFTIDQYGHVESAIPVDILTAALAH